MTIECIVMCCTIISTGGMFIYLKEGNLWSSLELFILGSKVLLNLDTLSGGYFSCGIR